MPIVPKAEAGAAAVAGAGAPAAAVAAAAKAAAAPVTAAAAAKKEAAAALALALAEAEAEAEAATASAPAGAALASASAAPGPWQAGWWRGAQALPSPNRNARPAGAQIDLVVLHSISLPPGRYGGCEVQQLFTNQLDWRAHPYFESIRGIEVSAHFYLRRDGAIWQFVSCDERAWHAGASLWRGRANCNDDSIGIELEGLEGDPFEPAQYAALAGLCSAISAAYPIAHVAGHEHIAPGRKGDPGAGFDWGGLQARLGWGEGMFPPGVLGIGMAGT